MCCLLALLYLRLAFRKDNCKIRIGAREVRWDVAEWMMDYECMRVEDVLIWFSRGHCIALHGYGRWFTALVHWEVRARCRY